MKRNALLTIMTLLALLLCAPASFAQRKDKDKDKDKEIETEAEEAMGERMERALPVDGNVVVTLCIASGDIIVRGWEKNEVKVVAENVKQLELQGGGQTPSKRLEIVVSNSPKSGDESLVCDCNATSNMEINVPRGAIVDVRLRSGETEISQVTEARVDNTSGSITLNNVTRGIEAKTISGDITVASSSGRINLRSVSGDIQASNVRTVDAGDDFNAHTTSGDINLDGVGQARLSANTTSGTVTMTGPLAQRGNYDLKTFSGDVVLNIPPDSSFRVNALAPRGEVITEFEVKSANDTDSRNMLEEGRLSGVYGSGERANLTLNSFNGTVRLQKRK